MRKRQLALRFCGSLPTRVDWLSCGRPRPCALEVPHVESSLGGLHASRVPAAWDISVQHSSRFPWLSQSALLGAQANRLWLLVASLPCGEGAAAMVVAMRVCAGPCATLRAGAWCLSSPELEDCVSSEKPPLSGGRQRLLLPCSPEWTVYFSVQVVAKGLRPDKVVRRGLVGVSANLSSLL